MSSDSESKSRKLLAEYLVLTFFLSWGLWTPVVMMFADVAQPPLWAVLLVFCGIYGPVLKEIERLALILRWIVESGLEFDGVLLEASLQLEAKATA